MNRGTIIFVLLLASVVLQGGIALTFMTGVVRVPWVVQAYFLGAWASTLGALALWVRPATRTPDR